MSEHQQMIARPASRSSRIGRMTGLQVRVRTLAEVDDAFRRAWLDLEADASCRHPFTSADYVLPAARHLPDLAPPLFLTVERHAELQALCVLENSSGSRRLPVRHLRAWQTPHTYFDAPLLRRGAAEQAMEEFWNYLLRGRHEWHGVEFPRFPNQEPVTRAFEGTARAAGVSCSLGTCWQRACLEVGTHTSAEVMQHLSLKRAKSLRRGWQQLQKQGPARFEFQQDSAQLAACAEELISLEHLGWKAESGTSLASQAAHQRFFRELAANFQARNNLFFSRILIADRGVASVVHLQSGDVAYAFKLGWDPATERGCPGFQLKFQAAMHAASDLPGVRMIDSCSSPDSFIEHVWPHRRSFCSRVFVTSPVGQMAANMVSGLRWMRDSAVAVSRHFSLSEVDQ